jgi:aspartate racemase
MNDKVIGIIGGMGPEATASFYMKIVKRTKVKKDQEHFRVIIDSNAKIPDRTEAILGMGESPVEAMVATAKNLERLGVDVGCIPCMTAHYFIEDIQVHISYPILNAFIEVRKYIAARYPEVKNIGILATSGTIKMKLFEKYLEGIHILYPNACSQKEKVMEAIYGDEGIKSGNLEGVPLELLKEAGQELMESGAELLILGCTEIGLALKQNHLPIPLIDPMEVMANVLVKRDI